MTFKFMAQFDQHISSTHQSACHINKLLHAGLDWDKTLVLALLAHTAHYNRSPPTNAPSLFALKYGPQTTTKLIRWP